VRVLLSDAHDRGRDPRREAVGATETTRGGGVSRRRFGARDLVAILFAAITFGVILAILWQNFLQVD
jgi:hypothetical protein